MTWCAVPAFGWCHVLTGAFLQVWLNSSSLRNEYVCPRLPDITLEFPLFSFLTKSLCFVAGCSLFIIVLLVVGMP